MTSVDRFAHSLGQILGQVHHKPADGSGFVGNVYASALAYVNPVAAQVIHVLMTGDSEMNMPRPTFLTFKDADRIKLFTLVAIESHPLFYEAVELFAIGDIGASCQCNDSVYLQFEAVCAEPCPAASDRSVLIPFSAGFFR